MAVDFLTPEQKATYGQYAGEPSEAQLSRYFHLDESDLAFVANRRGDQNRLGVALQLTTVRYLGTFLTDISLVPANVKRYVGRQLSVQDLSVLIDYAQRDTTKREHNALIRKHYGYKEFGDPSWVFRLSRVLYARAWISNERPSVMFGVAVTWLVHHKVLLPGESTLSRLISEIRKRAADRLWQKLSSLPNESQRVSLKTLFQVPEGQRTSEFDRLRKGATTVSGPALNLALKRYLDLRAFGIHDLNFSNIPPVRLKNLARYAGVTSTHKIARMSEDRRIAVLVGFVKAFETIALDESLDILDMLTADIAKNARVKGRNNRLRTLKDLDRTALTLAAVCTLLLDDELSNDEIRETVFADTPKEVLAETIAVVNSLARPANDQYHRELVEQYGRVRRFLPNVLAAVEFKAAPAGIATMNALNYLTEMGTTWRKILDKPPLDFITQPWRQIVFDDNDQVLMRGYVLCFLNTLQDSLRRRDVYVANSDRWNDPRSKLLQGREWQANRQQVCRSLGHPILPDEAITSLTKQLDATYKQVAARFECNQSVRVDHTGKHPALTITNLDKLEEPASLTNLSGQVAALLPKIDLTELVLEIHAHTSFADEFTHVSESNARVDDLPVSLCAVLLAEACNIGLEPLIKHNVPALTRHRLSWVKQNYIRSETLVRANARLVDYQATLSLAMTWGGGEIASADGMRFVTPVRTINSGPNPKYFNSGRGITWYNFVSDQYSGFHGIVIPGTLRDSIFVLEGLLEQQTGIRPTEIMTDTSGVSDMVFGLFWLLGYQFSPRLADAGEAVFWRIDKSADYGPLNDVARGYINTQRVAQHWDDMLRIAGSLKLGTVRASELIRSLLKSERPSGLAQAIMEIGRIDKTLYLLNYIDDEDYRRRILNQLNRGEGRHSVARTICYGQRGEIRKRYREGQEDQLGALGLVTNAVILWNTVYMQAALEHIQVQQSGEIKEDDVARLSPLIHEHVNVLGRYSFTLTEKIENGQLRPLNQKTRGNDLP